MREKLLHSFAMVLGDIVCGTLAALAIITLVCVPIGVSYGIVWVLS